jgi:hypothetical protein
LRFGILFPHPITSQKQQHRTNAASFVLVAEWGIFEMSQVIIADVVRRLLRYQIHDYSRAKSILDATSLSEMAQRIVEEEPGVVAALYACVYDRNGELRRDEQASRPGLHREQGVEPESQPVSRAHGIAASRHLHGPTRQDGQ